MRNIYRLTFFIQPFIDLQIPIGIIHYYGDTKTFKAINTEDYGISIKDDKMAAIIRIAQDRYKRDVPNLEDVYSNVGPEFTLGPLKAIFGEWDSVETVYKKIFKK